MRLFLAAAAAVFFAGFLVAVLLFDDVAGFAAAKFCDCGGVVALARVGFLVLFDDSFDEDVFFAAAAGFLVTVLFFDVCFDLVVVVVVDLVRFLDLVFAVFFDADDVGLALMSNQTSFPVEL